MLRVYHLTGSNADSKRPLNDDIQNESKTQQVVPCNEIGDWEKRHSIFKVKNGAEIEEVFRQCFA